jgi:hypothetical protein
MQNCRVKTHTSLSFGQLGWRDFTARERPDRKQYPQVSEKMVRRADRTVPIIIMRWFSSAAISKEVIRTIWHYAGEEVGISPGVSFSGVSCGDSTYNILYM